MKSNLNKHLLTAEDIIRYAEPETEDEKILFEALKTACSQVSELETETEKVIDALRSEVADLEGANSALEKEAIAKDLSIETLEASNASLEEKFSKLKDLVEA